MAGAESRDREPSRRPRILFLADRNIPANQAYNAFSAFPEDALARIEPSDIRKKLLQALADKGFGHDQLTEMQKIIDAEKSDLFDVLAHVAYALPPVAREVSLSANGCGIITTMKSRANVADQQVDRRRAGAPPVRRGARSRNEEGVDMGAFIVRTV